MVVFHNAILRGLSSIYHHTNLIAQTRIPLPLPSNPSSALLADLENRDSFVGFCAQWSAFVKCHHTGEETILFPRLIKTLGITNLMDQDVTQHQEMAEGLARFDAYIVSVSPQPSPPKQRTAVLYGPDLRAIVESLIPSCIAHNYSEIASVLSLKEFRDPQILKDFQDWSAAKAREVPFFTTTMYFITNHDMGYEGGRTKDIPPIPWVIRWVCGAVGWWPYRRSWRFSSCDSWGRLRKKA